MNEDGIAAIAKQLAEQIVAGKLAQRADLYSTQPWCSDGLNGYLLSFHLTNIRTDTDINEYEFHTGGAFVAQATFQALSEGTNFQQHNGKCDLLIISE